MSSEGQKISDYTVWCGFALVHEKKKMASTILFKTKLQHCNSPAKISFCLYALGHAVD